jgi:hypothetical protein
VLRDYLQRPQGREPEFALRLGHHLNLVLHLVFLPHHNCTVHRQCREPELVQVVPAMHGACELVARRKDKLLERHGGIPHELRRDGRVGADRYAEIPEAGRQPGVGVLDAEHKTGGRVVPPPVGLLDGAVLPLRADFQGMHVEIAGEQGDHEVGAGALQADHFERDHLCGWVSHDCRTA